MTRSAAAYRYRASVATAIKLYSENLRDLAIRFADNTDARRDGMVNAWGTLRVMWALAEVKLRQDRILAKAEAIYAEQWRQLCLEHRGF